MRRISVVCVVLTFWCPSHVYIIFSTYKYISYIYYFLYIFYLFDRSFCTLIFYGFPPSPPRHAPPGSRSPSVPTVRLPLPTQPERHLPCVQCQPCQPSAWFVWWTHLLFSTTRPLGLNVRSIQKDCELFFALHSKISEVRFPDSCLWAKIMTGNLCPVTTKCNDSIWLILLFCMLWCLLLRFNAHQENQIGKKLKMFYRYF